jgi:hypothetical protein
MRGTIASASRATTPRTRVDVDLNLSSGFTNA